jgi:hypothetical protein
MVGECGLVNLAQVKGRWHAALVKAMNTGSSGSITDGYFLDELKVSYLLKDSLPWSY